MPTLSLSGGLGSNYYLTSKFDSDPFGKQLKNNFSQYIGLSLNIPIFNRFQTRNNVRNARIEQENQLLALDNTKKTLYKGDSAGVLQHPERPTEGAQFQETVRSSNDAFTLMLAKYENGKANITEFNEAKNVYLKAESDRVQLCMSCSISVRSSSSTRDASCRSERSIWAVRPPACQCRR